jgi:hypothetical protein
MSLSCQLILDLVFRGGRTGNILSLDRRMFPIPCANFLGRRSGRNVDFRLAQCATRQQTP